MPLTLPPLPKVVNIGVIDIEALPDILAQIATNQQQLLLFLARLRKALEEQISPLVDA